MQSCDRSYFSTGGSEKFGRTRSKCLASTALTAADFASACFCDGSPGGCERRWLGDVTPSCKFGNSINTKVKLYLPALLHRVQLSRTAARLALAKRRHVCCSPGVVWMAETTVAAETVLGPMTKCRPEMNWESMRSLRGLRAPEAEHLPNPFLAHSAPLVVWVMLGARQLVPAS